MSSACLVRGPVLVAILLVLASACGGVSRGSHGEHDDGVPLSGAGGTAGTGGVGASSPVGGAAGAPAPSDCTFGSACRSGGSTCVVEDAGACCLKATYSCEAGRWSGPQYSDCGSLACPSSLPQDGDACGPCGGSCDYDMCRADGGGQNLAVNCLDGHWQTVHGSCWQCCQNDADCPNANAQCVQGRCLSTDNSGGEYCNGDKECGQGQICAGALICPCGDPAKCEYGEDQGTCVPADLGCCATNADCKAGETCVAGVCKPPAPEESCWSSLDCPFRFGCNRANVCPCGSSCLAPDAPGQCAVPR